MEEIGANLMVEPFLETSVIAVNLLRAADGQGTALAEIAKGDARYALAWDEPGPLLSVEPVATVAARTQNGWRLEGCKAVVMGAPWATHLIVTAVTENEPGNLHN